MRCGHQPNLDGEMVSQVLPVFGGKYNDCAGAFNIKRIKNESK